MRKKKVVTNINKLPTRSPFGVTGLSNTQAPVVPMTHQMVGAIKQSPKGHLPPGLLKYLAAKKAAKGGK